MFHRLDMCLCWLGHKMLWSMREIALLLPRVVPGPIARWLLPAVYGHGTEILTCYGVRRPFVLGSEGRARWLATENCREFAYCCFLEEGLRQHQDWIISPVELYLARCAVVHEVPMDFVENCEGVAGERDDYMWRHEAVENALYATRKALEGVRSSRDFLRRELDDAIRDLESAKLALRTSIREDGNNSWMFDEEVSNAAS